MNNIQFYNSVSFAKGIGIMLMVLGHTFFSVYGYTVIYMFHMPLFFFLSGYCFRVSHLEDFRNYAQKRVSRIYVPFVKWSLIFLLLHNIFFHLNIYNDTFGFEGEVSQLYSVSDYLKKTFFIFFCLSGNEQLLGGYWFLHTMFFASFIFYGLLKLKIPIIGGVVTLLLSVLLYFKGIPVVNIYCGPKELFAVSCMMAGYLYKSYSIEEIVDKYSMLVLLGCALLLLLGSVYWRGDMLDMIWTHTIPYFISAIAGSIVVMMVSKYLTGKTHRLSSFISNIGNKTIEILTWHFLSFKIVSLIIIAYYGLPIEQLAEFPVLRPYNTQGWWIGYLVVGVAVPVIGSGLKHSLCKGIKK
ncbi:acyltransferase family protein [Prevotella communis]|nr:acyltransferase family protein [Prevotella communis]